MYDWRSFPLIRFRVQPSDRPDTCRLDRKTDPNRTRNAPEFGNIGSRVPVSGPGGPYTDRKQTRSAAIVTMGMYYSNPCFMGFQWAERAVSDPGGGEGETRHESGKRRVWDPKPTGHPASRPLL